MSCCRLLNTRLVWINQHPKVIGSDWIMDASQKKWWVERNSINWLFTQWVTLELRLEFDLWCFSGLMPQVGTVCEWAKQSIDSRTHNGGGQLMSIWQTRQTMHFTVSWWPHKHRKPHADQPNRFCQFAHYLSWCIAAKSPMINSQNSLINANTSILRRKC